MIQWLSICLQYSTSSLWIFLIAIIERSSIKWSNRLNVLPLFFQHNDGLCLSDGLLVVRRVHSPFLLRTRWNISCIFWGRWRYWFASLLIECNKYSVQYVGETENTLHVWLTGHHLDINYHHIEKQVTRHFTLSDHSMDDLSIMMIEKIHKEDVEYRRQKESHWITTIHSMRPNLLNQTTWGHLLFDALKQL